MLKRALALALLASFSAQARVIHSIEYAFSPAYLEGLAQALTRATERPDKDKIGAMSLLKDGAREVPSYLSCRAGQPQPEGYGCFVGFKPVKESAEGEFRVTIEKPVNLHYLREQLRALKAKLAATNPAGTEDRVHIGNPLTSPDLVDDNSHFYCQASEDKKAWDCRFYVHE